VPPIFLNRARHSKLAYHPESESIVFAFTNIFGDFNEHDFFMDKIIPVIVDE